MADTSALLGNIFQMVTNTLSQNQQSLDQADDQNHDHGTNMVQTFQTITRALNERQSSSASDALAHAADAVSKESTSGSGKLYSQGLSQAATQLQGQNFNPQTAVQLLQTLIGGGQATQSGGSDILGSILGGLGGSQAQPQQATQPAGGDILGSILGELSGAQAQPQQSAQPAGENILGGLLGGLTGSGTPQPNTGANNGLDMGDLVNAGMSYMQAKQSGGSNAQALLQAVLAGSGMGNSNHRAQSTQLVANSFMQALGALTNKSG